MKRRDFLKLSAITAALVSTPLNALTNTPEIVIIGGGFSGATCAKYLKLWAGSSVNVTIIEKNLTYTSPILSNLVLNNQKNINDLTFDYSTLISYGVKFVNKEVINFDTNNKTITLDDNTKLNYDKLVLAAGIDFVYTNQYDITKIPHAWDGRTINDLKDKIDTLNEGDTFVMSIPKAPYRCPPGPYERACVVADYLKDKNIKVVVLDENDDIIVEADTFHKKFTDYSIEYISNARVIEVNDSNMEVKYTKDNNENIIRAKAINIIPNQKAAKVVFLAGVNDGNFAPVDTKSYKSLLKEDIYIVGDSQNSSQPKAGHIGNGEAKICADAILRELNGYELYQTPKTNSTCYSPVSSTEASWLTAIYEYDSITKDMKLVDGYPIAASPDTKNYSDMFKWSGNLFSDTFS